MSRILFLVLPLCIFCCACNTGNNEEHREKWKSEIVNTEKEFAEMADKEGVELAFLAYADDDAVLKRNNKLIIGKEALKESYKNNTTGADNESLTWKPDFVYVSLSGDLGYTYGKYIYTYTDSIGSTNVVEGIFHTVWKKQADGKWKFVWD